MNELDLDDPDIMAGTGHGKFGTDRASFWRENEVPQSEAEEGGNGVASSPWHRRVSPVFFVLLVIAGVMLGGVAYALVSLLPAR